MRWSCFREELGIADWVRATAPIGMPVVFGSKPVRPFARIPPVMRLCGGSNLKVFAGCADRVRHEDEFHDDEGSGANSTRLGVRRQRGRAGGSRLVLAASEQSPICHGRRPVGGWGATIQSYMMVIMWPCLMDLQSFFLPSMA